jgi:hypothetical protein
VYLIKIVVVSDTHECHRELEVPPRDLLIHCGDSSFFSRRPSQIHDFNTWLVEQPARYRVCAAGNHELAVEAAPTKWNVD